MHLQESSVTHVCGGSEGCMCMYDPALNPNLKVPETAYEWRACAGDRGQPMEDCEGPYETRAEAEARLPFMQGDPPYEVMWIERRPVSHWEHVTNIDVRPVR